MCIAQPKPVTIIKSGCKCQAEPNLEVQTFNSFYESGLGAVGRSAKIDSPEPTHYIYNEGLGHVNVCRS